jgi:hypothetical protein
MYFNKCVVLIYHFLNLSAFNLGPPDDVGKFALSVVVCFTKFSFC